MSGKNEKIKLSVKDKSYDLSMHEGTIGPEVINISKLYSESGNFTYDPGFTSTASCNLELLLLTAKKEYFCIEDILLTKLPKKGISLKHAIFF